MVKKLGYSKNLFILPFDHRSTFEKGMFGVSEENLTSEIIAQIKKEKRLIYEAFKKAVSDEISKETAAILVDEEFGDEILKDAKAQGLTTILTTEKSGQKEFAFEYGEDFENHIRKYNPTFAKALIRFNPQDSPDSKKRQGQRLKRLSDFCHNNGIYFLAEVLVEPSESQSSSSSDKEKFDKDIRPQLSAKAILELQDQGVEPDVWKMEGAEKEDDYKLMVENAKRDGRENVGVIILGRGESLETVDKWIKTGKNVAGIIGFAVGRTVFWDPLMDFKNGKISEEEAIAKISGNFIYYYELFTN